MPKWGEKNYEEAFLILFILWIVNDSFGQNTPVPIVNAKWDLVGDTAMSQ